MDQGEEVQAQRGRQPAEQGPGEQQRVLVGVVVPSQVIVVEDPNLEDGVVSA